MSTAQQIKGWCPSAWRPMLTGDGYLVRLHFSCGIVRSAQARAIAALAQRNGNGVIDLTRRANLQIRGVREEQIVELQDRLLAEKLIPEDGAAEAVPNVIASPLAGWNRDALIDIRPLVRELERQFASDLRPRDLPAKFCITVDDGGRFSLRDLESDIAFEAIEQDERIGFAVRIGGEPGGFVETHELPETALALVSAFNMLRRDHVPPVRRMSDLVARQGLAAITASCPALSRASTMAWSAPRQVDGWVKSGHDAVGRIDSALFGAGAPFGSLRAAQLALVADLADRYAEGEVRLTPWRSLFLPGIASGVLEPLEAECARAGLVTDSSDPRRRAAACVGAPGCASASVETRAIAAALTPHLREHDTLHVSGCVKSCASSQAASVTLVGREGRYDLVRNGKAGDAPTLSGLSAAQVRTAVDRLSAEDLAYV